MVKVVSFRFQHCLIHLPCCLSKGPLKCDFLDIYLTTFFGIRNFGKTLAMKVIFFVKVRQILLKFKKCRKKLAKSFLFSR